MAHAAIAFAKASRRRRMMACTTSIGPGATNMVTAAAVAHVNRLPVLLLPGDVFANRRPDPVLQQIEDFADGTVSANDCFRPVSRYFDRIARPEQIIPALQRAMKVLTDPAECGPVTLALCQDVQAEAYDYPESFFAERIWTQRRIRPDDDELAKRGGVAEGRAASRSSSPAAACSIRGADGALADFAEHARHSGGRDAGRQIALCRTTIRLNLGAIGVTGTGGGECAGRRGRRGARGRHAAAGFHHRLLGAVQESRTAASSASTSRPSTPPSTARCRWSPTRASASRSSAGARRLEGARRLDRPRRATRRRAGSTTSARYTDPTNAELPSDAQVIGAVQRSASAERRRGRARRAGCRANCTSSGRRRARRLPHGIRLFLHGLRDRRRPRRQDGAIPTAK